MGYLACERSPVIGGSRPRTRVTQSGKSAYALTGSARAPSGRCGPLEPPI